MAKNVNEHWLAKLLAPLNEVQKLDMMEFLLLDILEQDNKDNAVKQFGMLCDNMKEAGVDPKMLFEACYDIAIHKGDRLPRLLHAGSTAQQNYLECLKTLGPEWEKFRNEKKAPVSPEAQRDLQKEGATLKQHGVGSNPDKNNVPSNKGLPQNRGNPGINF